MVSGKRGPRPKPSLSGIDLNLLVAFEALYRERSVTRAGRRLGLSQPATSAALARLRVALGDDLFVTTPHGLEPTARCALLAEPVAAALDQLQRALAYEENFEPRLSEVTFRIGAVDAVMVVLLRGLAEHVTLTAPRARLVLRSVDPREAPALIDSGDIELAIAPVPNPPAHLEVRDLFRVRLAVACRVGHPLSDSPSLAELARYPHVLVSFAGPPRTAVDDAFEAVGLERHVAVVLSSFLAVPHVLESTDAVALVPEPFARELGRARRIRCVSLPAQIASGDLRMRLLWPRRVHDSAAWRWMRASIGEVLAGGAR